MQALQVYTFAPAWGLPSAGPFALKLLAWLSLHGIPHRQIIENRPGRGPEGKSPWIARGGRRMGDSDRIIADLAARHGLPGAPAPDTPAAAHGLALRALFEQEVHQVLEYELFVHPGGRAFIDHAVAEDAPRPLAPLVAAGLRRHFRRQLRARGIGRLAPAEVAARGARALDALAALRAADAAPFFGGDGPDLTDLAVWGQVAPLLHWPMPTPAAAHAKRLPAVATWAEAVRHACFARADARAA